MLLKTRLQISDMHAMYLKQNYMSIMHCRLWHVLSLSWKCSLMVIH